VTGSGSNRNRRLVHEEQWRGAWMLDHRHAFHAGEQVDLRFRGPVDLPPTRLGDGLPVFRQFEVALELPGFDSEEIDLVPVHAPR
jgi:hypothetical protein